MCEGKMKFLYTFNIC